MNYMEGLFVKAILFNEHGDENVLYEKEIDRPTIGHNEVLIEIKSFSINPADIVEREGRKQPLPLTLPHILGKDFVGVVKEVGVLCQSIQPNDIVTGINFGGTYAEYISMTEHDVVKIPQGVNLKRMAGFPVVAITAWAGLIEHGLLESGQKVLIHAGAGGVGHIAIQIAKQAGAYVYTTGSERNTEFLKQLGADEVINYQTTDFTTIAIDVDLVLDTMGGEVQRNSFKPLKKGGRLISVVHTPDEELSKQYDVYSNFIYGNPDKTIELVNKFVRGQFVCHIDTEYSFSLDEIRQAHVDLSQGHTRGKRIVSFN